MERTMDVDSNDNGKHLKLTLPTGRIQEKVVRLLDQIGVTFLSSDRSYRPVCTDPLIQAKSLKPQNIPALVALGRHDCGFSGYDWIYEQEADVVELLDLGFDPVRIVAAAPEELVDSKRKFADRDRRMIVASEYERLAKDFIKQENLNAIYLHAFGATEALPPEDADIIIDNTASGTTLRHNRLQVIGELMKSTTRFFCNKAALQDPFKRQKLEEMTMLMKSTIQAREKVLIEMNIGADVFESVVNQLPCMKAPTISKLHNSDGYAVKIAVPTRDVPELIPRLVKLGATDILEYKVEKIVL
jgi:ATP phosphoribosyltransferase